MATRICAIDAALEKSWLAQQQGKSMDRDRATFERLSPRERQVCLHVAQGMLNKQIAAEFGTKERTIKKQRGSLMQKLQVDSAADLVERLRSVGYFAGNRQ